MNLFLSKKWKQWKAFMDSKTCWKCKEENGKIYSTLEKMGSKPHEHYKCRCIFVVLQAVSAGKATNRGIDGADWWLKYKGKLPDYYITRERAFDLGWDRKAGNLGEVAPGCMIDGGIYHNLDGVLPKKRGRIWYEADINYEKGRRNTDRILYSSDGLIFITLDHYETFIEVR